MEESILSGKIWVLTDSQNQLIEDIDTDQIYHNAFLHITELERMGEYAFGNLEGWRDFSQKAQPGDIILTGRNFGAGSSRQQAVDCFLALGINLIISPSFGAIYFRNAVNSGFPLLHFPSLGEEVVNGNLKSGDQLQVNVLSGEGSNLSRGIEFLLEPMGSVQYEIWQAGGLFPYARSKLKD